MAEKKIYVSTYLRLENVGRRALGLKTDGEFAGVFRQGVISAGGAFTVIAASLSPYYIEASEETKEKIDNILGDYSYLNNKSTLTEDEYAEGIDKAVETLKEFLNEYQK